MKLIFAAECFELTTLCNIFEKTSCQKLNNRSIFTLPLQNYDFWEYYLYHKSITASNQLTRPWSKQSLLKVRQSRKQIIVPSILPKNEQKITILSLLTSENTQDMIFLSFFGRSLDTIICFRDLPTFRHKGGAKSTHFNFAHFGTFFFDPLW